MRYYSNRNYRGAQFESRETPPSLAQSQQQEDSGIRYSGGEVCMASAEEAAAPV